MANRLVKKVIAAAIIVVVSDYLRQWARSK